MSARNFSKFFLSLQIIMLEKLNTVLGDFCLVLVTIFYVVFMVVKSRVFVISNTFS